MFALSTLALFAAVALGLANAEPTPSQSKSTSCSSSEFYYAARDCCLPQGGPSKVPSPPSGTACPTTHYYNFDQGCCVPYHPNPPPQPTCPSKYSWEASRQCCTPNSPPQPSPPKPSSKPGKYRSKRNFDNQWDVSSCPSSLTTCYIAINGLLTSDTECVDTFADLTSCGGCASINKGKDCSKIPNATSSTCQGGECVVEECVAGYKPSDDESTCVSA